jgi:hypothetical protein
VAHALDPIRLFQQLEQLQQAIFRCATICSPCVSSLQSAPTRVFSVERCTVGTLQVSGSAPDATAALRTLYQEQERRKRVYGLGTSWLFPTLDDAGCFLMGEFFSIGSYNAFSLITTIVESQNHQKFGRAHIMTSFSIPHRPHTIKQLLIDEILKSCSGKTLLCRQLDERERQRTERCASSRSLPGIFSSAQHLARGRQREVSPRAGYS